MTTKQPTLCLPGGFTDKAGTLHREVELRPLTGRVEEQLVRNGDTDGAPAIDFVLGHCLERVGTVTPVPTDVAAGLSETDRSYLLMALYREIFGDRVRGRVSCPGPGCGETEDIDFSIQDIIAGGAFDGGAEGGVDLEVHCPECNAVFDFPFRPAGFFLGRLKDGLSMLYREVHVLAYHYHWSEAEILALPREKRHMYLEFLAESPVEAIPVHPIHTGSMETGAGHGVSTPGDDWTDRADRPNRSHKSYRSYRSYRTNGTNGTYNAESPSPLSGEDIPPENKAAGHTEVTEIQLPPAAPPAGGAYNPPAGGPYKAARGASQPPAVGPSNHAARGPSNPAAQGAYKAAGGASEAVRQESHSPAQEIDEVYTPPDAVRPTPKTAPRETPETTWTPFYTNSRSPVPSAFWARSYLGRFHLRTLR